MRAHLRVLAVACAAALLSGCEPRTIEVQGLDELTAEIRSQRKLLRNGGLAGAGGADAGAQIQSAMTPLRDVLTQMGTTQRELSERQAALTKEMRRWTQLLVQSMQSERADEAKKLGERLAELERTIAEQDKRHRKVEELMGSALDRTADQLEEFLRRIGAPVGPSGAPAGAGGAAKPEEGAKPAGSGGQDGRGGEQGRGGEPGTPDPNRGTAEGSPPANENREGSTGGSPAGSERGGGGNEPDAAQRGSLAWLWGLAVLSLVSGLALLFGRRRTQPVAMAPEMQYAPDPGAELVASGAADWTEPDATAAAVLDEAPVAPVQPPAAVDPLPEVTADPAAPSTIPEDAASVAGQADNPEVEELWAAAALLGEAIGRLKQTSGESAQEVLGRAAAAAGAVTPERDDATKVAEGSATPNELDVPEADLPEADLPSRDMPTVDELAADELSADARALDGLAADADPREFELDDLFVIDEDDEPQGDVLPVESSPSSVAPQSGDEKPVVSPELQEAPQEMPQEVPQVRPIEPPAVPAAVEHEAMPDAAPVVSRPVASGAVAVRHASSAPETCCLQLRGDSGAEGRLRSMLGRDPRVLVSPAPEVRSDMGALEVRFALLPGLTAGERSLLEQQLRDTVA